MRKPVCLFTDVCHLVKTQMTVYGVWFPSGHEASACVHRAVIISHLPGQNRARRGVALYLGWRSFAICVCWRIVRFHRSWMVGSARLYPHYSKFINCPYSVCRQGGKSDCRVTSLLKEVTGNRTTEAPGGLFWNNWESVCLVCVLCKMCGQHSGSSKRIRCQNLDKGVFLFKDF